MNRISPMTATKSKARLMLDSQRHALARIAAGDAVVDVLDELVRQVDVAARKHAEDALRNQTRRLETFNRLSKSIATDLDLERIVQTVTDIATELSGAKFGAFFYNVTDGKGERYLLYTLSGAPREAFARLGLPRNTALFQPTFGGNGIVRCDDVRTDPRFGKSEPHFGMPKGHLPVVSYLAVPVISQSGEVHGGLFFGHDKPAAFGKEAEEIVKAVATHAASAIDNARLLQATRRELAERRREAERHRRRTEALMKESEARLQEALAAGQVMAFEWDAATDSTHRSQNAAEILGFTRGSEPKSLGDFLASVHPHDRAEVKAHIRSLRPASSSYAINFRYIRPDGREVWLEETAKGEFDADGSCVRLKGLTRDITERKRAQEHQSLLIAELDHRVKNVLSCVAAIVQRTRESSGSTGEFTDALKRRIHSMANTHALLSRGRWQGANLAELVDGELAPWGTEGSVTVAGPQVFLAAEATQAMAMVLHELATNAAKYGALSGESGRVAVRWHCGSNGSASTAVFLEWQEKGGPPVIAPTAPGYGTSVICDLIPYELGGAVDLIFAAEGVGCRIVIPAKWVGSPGFRMPRRGLASSYLEKVGDALSVHAHTLS
jgi:PAS domain S-box-containing protein